MICQYYGTHRKLQNSIHCQTPAEEPPRGATINVLLHDNYQEEQTPRIYKPITGTAKPLNLPVKHFSSGELHPYRIYDTNCIGQFPISFQGCFKYGSTSHLSRKDCHKYYNFKSNSKLCKELWIQKPHVKKNPQIPRVQYKLMDLLQDFHPDTKNTNFHKNYLTIALPEHTNTTPLLG